MKQISLSNEIQTACPDLCVLALSCQVKNTPNDADLWELIHQEETLVREQVKLNEINKWLPIQATRQAYKKLGKDPNRYRPSAESLRRRILRELPLYQIETWFRSTADIPSADLMKIKYKETNSSWESDKKAKSTTESVGENSISPVCPYIGIPLEVSERPLAMKNGQKSAWKLRHCL